MKTAIDPVPPSALPSFQQVTTPVPSMPSGWTATVLLHPFSPPLSTDPRPDNPFFQLCVANVICVPGLYFSAQVTGCSYGRWWYEIRPEGTRVSTDGGTTWTRIDVGWSVPLYWFGTATPKAACAGASPLNWMAAQTVEWWKAPVKVPDSRPDFPPGATWMWFDSNTKAPVRMMFGVGPPSPTKGDPTQLAFFQMWSFTYFPDFQLASARSEATAKPKSFVPASFPGFEKGNPNGYKNFVWNSNFGMTAFMTPVNEIYNPLPTRVLYVWKPDDRYSVYSDRSQDTLMMYGYNENDPEKKASQEALLTGPAPAGTTPPPNSRQSFLINRYTNGAPATCLGGGPFHFPQEPPDWVSIPAVEGTIQATITNNPVVGPNNVVTIFSVLFPPAKNYPEATYLWTWYTPQNPDGTESRPITFMQSQSGVGVGTSLALADYYYYENFSKPIDPSNFDIPSVCSPQTRNTGLRGKLP